MRENTPHPIGKYDRYSVLVPLTEQDGELCVLFEVRSDELKSQPGEISFPGGMIDGNETPKEAAIRETCEELCLAESDVTVLGELNYIIAYGSFTMFAFLGELNPEALANTSPSADEVKEIFCVPLDFFLHNKPEVYTNIIVPEIAPDFPISKVTKSGNYKWKRGKNEVPLYTWFDERKGEERIIWGLTARIMQDFAELLAQQDRKR